MVATTPRPETPPALRQQRKKYLGQSSYNSNRYFDDQIVMVPFFSMVNFFVSLRSQKSRRTFRESRYNGGINAEGMEGPRRQEVWQDIHHHRVIFKRPPTKSCRCKKNPRAMFRDTRRSTKCRI